MNRNLVIVISVCLLAALLIAAGLITYFARGHRTVPEWVEGYTRHGTLPKDSAKESTPSERSQAAAKLVARDRPTDITPTTPSADPDRDALERENEGLVALNQKLRGQLVELLNWILANYKGKYPLPERHISKLKLNPVTEEFALNPDVAEFLNMSPEDAAMISDAMSYARAIIDDIEHENTTLSSPYPDKVIVRVPAYPEEGQIIREDLYAALEITLGADTFDRFMDVTEDGLEENFHRFGNASRTIIFELVYIDGQSGPQLVIKDGWIIQQEDGSRLIQATESMVEALPKEYADYADSLPRGVQLPAE